jgi:hypothetical protein
MSIDEIINDYGTDEKGEQAFEDAQWPREWERSPICVNSLNY